MKNITLVDASNEIKVLRDVKVPDRFFNRFSLGVQLLDEMFGGTELPGILPGSSFLFTGMPGAGKSTMCLQLADKLQMTSNANVLYNIGEESEYVIRIRADRIGLTQEFNIGQICDVDILVEKCLEFKIDVLFQDSLQSLRDSSLGGAQCVKSVVKKLHRLSKDNGITVFIVGHITKGGQFAGPQEIKHDVDAHIHLSLNEETGNRIFEFQKNRFGPACIPYEFLLSENGLDFNKIEATPVKKTVGKAAGRRENVMLIIREKLIAGEHISGYCFERLNIECSGGFWRSMIQKTCDELESEGVCIGEHKIGGRVHNFIDVSGRYSNRIKSIADNIKI